MATIDTLEIQISASSENAAKSIDKLVGALGRLKTAGTGGTKRFENLATSLKSLSDACDRDSISALGKAASAIERLANMKAIRLPKSLGDNLRNIGLACEMLTPQAIENLDKMTQSLQRLQNVDLRGVGSALRATVAEAKAKAKAQAAPADAGASTSTGETVSVPVLQSIRAAAMGAWDKLKELGKTVKLKIDDGSLRKAAQSVFRLSGLFKSLGRIAMYRMIRGVIKAMSTAFSEGLKNAYLFSQSITDSGHRFAEAMDTMKSASTQMKNQIGSAFIGLLTAVMPIILRLIDLVTRAADAISQFFAAFTGNTYLKASSVMDHWADATATGAKAAKEWRNQLLGFDEINRLEEPNNGGGGGGTTGLNPADMFESTQIDQKWIDRVEWLKTNFEFIKGLALAIGAAIAAWKVGRLITDIFEIKGHGKQLLGIVTSIAGAVLLVRGFADSIVNGLNWANFKEMLLGVVLLAGGLALAFGKTGGAIGLLIGGGALLVAGMREWISTGELTTEAFWALEAGIVAVSAAIALLTGGWIPLAIGAVVGIALAIYKYWDDIKAFLSRTWEAIKTKATEIFNKVKEAIITVWLNVKDTGAVIWNGIVDFVEGLWNGIKEKAEKIFEGVKTAVINAWLGIKNTGKVIWDGIVSTIQSAINTLLAPLQNLCDMFDGLFQRIADFLGIGEEFRRVSDPSYDVWTDPNMWNSNYASGGFPEAGQLFVAREAGPELVGTMGGRTAVANNDQIVEGIRSGVYDAVVAAMGSGGGGGTTEFKLYLDSREIRAGLQRLDRAWGA